MSSNLNRNTLDFYINHHFIHSLAILLNRDDVSDDDKTYIIDTLYIHYKNGSSSNKDKLIDLFIRYETVELFERIIFDDSITYGQIERMCTGIKNCDNERVKEWLNTNLLSLDVFISENFITNHPTQAAYVFLNTDVSEFEDLNIDNISSITRNDFIGCVALNYEASKHEEWLDYIITNTHDVLYALWSKNIRFSDAQLKAIDNSNPSIYDNGYIVAVIKSNFTTYVINECTHIISDLYSHGKLSSNEYSIIDLYNINSVTDVLKSGYIHAIDEASYKTSLLKKINDYSLVNIFNYLFGDEYINMSDQNYYLSRDDNDSIIRTALLSHYVDEEALCTISKESYNCLYMTVFELVIYKPFIYAIVNNTSTYTSEELAHLDSNYSAELAVCTYDENVYTVIVYTLENSMSLTFNNLITVKTIADESLNNLDSSYAEAMVNLISNTSRFVSYTIDHQMYNSLSLLIYKKNLTDNDYNLIRPIVNDEFKQALANNIGESSTIKTKSYKLLEHSCYDVFHYLVLNKLSDDDCYDFCFTTNNEAYATYRSYICDRFDSYDYTEYSRHMPRPVNNKMREDQFVNIKQTIYQTYEEYSSAYDANDKLFSNIAHPNRKIYDSLNVLMNILIFITFNAYNKHSYDVHFLRWVDVYFAHMSYDPDYGNNNHSYNTINFDSDLARKIALSYSMCEDLTTCITKMIDLHSVVAYWHNSDLKVRSIFYWVFNHCDDQSVLLKICKFLDSACDIVNISYTSYAINIHYNNIHFGGDDFIAYMMYDRDGYNISYKFESAWDLLQANECYAVMSLIIRFRESHTPILTQNQKQFIKNNWLKFVPYMTLGYTRLLLKSPLTEVDDIDSKERLLEVIATQPDHNNQWWSIEKDEHISECYSQRTRRLLSNFVTGLWQV